MKSPNLIQKARDLWNRKEYQRRADANKEADQRREEEARRERQRRDDRALEQFEKHASEYSADLDGPTLDEIPEDRQPAEWAGPTATHHAQDPVPTAGLPHHQYDMEPLIPLSEAEVEKLKVIEAEDPQGRGMRAPFDPRTVIALREQAETAQQRQDPGPQDDLEPDDELDM